MGLEEFFSHVARWLSQMLTKVTRQRAIGYVDVQKAGHRALQCRFCHYQKNWVKDCAPCRASVEGSRKILLKARPDLGDGLLGCGVLNEDTRVSVHLDLPKSGDSRLPGGCWRKK